MATENQKFSNMLEQGSVTSLFERLSRYVIKVDMNWIHSIKPAEQEKIKKLKRYSKIEKKGYDMPKSYKIFLEYMGEDDAGLVSDYLMADTSITLLCEYYENELKFEPESINPNILVFALSHMADQVSFDLRSTNEPKVIESIDGEIYEKYSESFEKLLFQSAFTKFEKLRFPVYSTYGGSQIMLDKALEQNQTDNIFDVVDEYAKNEKFTKAWFSDFRHYVGFREDAVFMAELRSGMILDLYGINEKFISAFGEKLSKAIGTNKKA